MGTEVETVNAGVTVLGRRKRGPSPKSQHKKIAASQIAQPAAKGVKHWRRTYEDRHEEITRGLLTQSQRSIDAFLKKLAMDDDRAAASGIIVTATNSAMANAPRIVSAMFWMLRTCGWDGLNDEIWDWWVDYLEVGYRVQLWDLTMEGIKIERECGENERLHAGQKFLRKW